MKPSLKTILAAAVLGVTALPMLSIAQENAEKAPPAQRGGRGGRGMMTPEQQVARLDEAVTLTADQKTKVTEIYKKAAADMQAIPQEERREKGMELMKATRDQVRALLTPEQQAKFDAMPMPGRGGRGGRPAGGGDGAKKN